MKILSEVTFSGFFGEKGTYFHGDTVTGTLYLETFQHLNVTGEPLFPFIGFDFIATTI